LGFVTQTIAGGEHMRPKELALRIDAFNRRRTKLLISTSVGEEGMHLPEANYGYALSQSCEPKRLAQRLGRIGHGAGFKEDKPAAASKRFVAEMHYFMVRNTQDEAMYYAGMRNRVHMERLGGSVEG
jgi:Fanconi anemia group M protein